MLALLGAVATAAAAGAQVSSDHYIELVPPAPLIVAARGATDRHAVYGNDRDPGYRDVAPADGIDDVQALRLGMIADRFAPILHRSNFSVPRNFKDALAPRALIADRWLNGRLVRRDSVTFDGSAADDRSLLELLAEIGPRRSMTPIAQPGRRAETIAYFDFPGRDERSWRTHYGASAQRPHTYVHFFVDEDLDTTRSNRFGVVAQYWFFYPFNDGANNHEGDWEHINVVITSRSHFARDRWIGNSSGLSNEEVARIVGGPNALPLDSMVIARVEYYFHHSVVTLDYAEADRRPAMTPHHEHATTHIWEDVGFVNYAVRERLTAAEGRLATHPIGYIAGEPRGPAELLQMRPRFRRSYGRNSHGTYPLPGLWVSVGQLATTEMVRGDLVPRWHRARPDLPWHALIADSSFVTFTPENITLLPDWERIEPLVMRDAAVRAEWAWLLLPVHFGFPASPSPGAGALSRTNLGQAAPHGPSFHSGWNVTGVTAEHAPHVSTVLRGAAAPAGPWLAIQSGWGVLNLPLALWGMMPGYNVVLSTALPYIIGARRATGHAPPRTYFRGSLPLRITSAGYGRVRSSGGHDLALLLPRDELRTAAGRVVSPTAPRTPARHEHTASDRLWLNLHYGRRFALENTFTLSSGELRYSVQDGARTSTVRAEVDTKVLTGGARYSVAMRRDELLQAYLRGGYGWSRSDIAPARLDADSLAVPRYRAGRLPAILPSASWRPNAVYGGVGAEIFAPRRLWALHRAGYGVRVDISGALTRLSVEGRRDVQQVARSTEVSVALTAGW